MTWWLLLMFADPLWAGVGALIYIFWSWRQIPAILLATAMPQDAPRREEEHTGLPEGAQWYQQPEPPGDPTNKSVYWPEEPSSRE